MIHNIDQAIKHNANFYNAFIDLKVVGWNSYSNAFNQYTFNFFRSQMKELDKSVENLGEFMKLKG